MLAVLMLSACRALSQMHQDPIRKLFPSSVRSSDAKLSLLGASITVATSFGRFRIRLKADVVLGS